MRDDLVDAQTCIDWTRDQFPALGERINSWLKLNVVVEVASDFAPLATSIVKLFD